jgi:hypothetical protein
MSVVTQLYFKIVEKNNYMFRPFSGWAIIRLRLKYRKKLMYYNVDIKHGERDLDVDSASPHGVYIATHLPKYCKTLFSSTI